jgi:molybdate transport system substrate-binding protein
MSRQAIVLLGSVVIVAAMLFALVGGPTRRDTLNYNSEKNDSAVVLFCAAANRAVMEDIRKEYEQEFKRTIQIQYGASQSLLSSIEVSGAGDLYLPADTSYIDLGHSKNLISEVLPLAVMRAVVAVRRGNPKEVRAFSDLLRTDVKLVQSSPDASAIGMRTRDLLTESNQWSPLEQKTIAFRTTVTDVANDLMVGAADAGIVYDAVLKSYPDLEAVSIPELDPILSNVSMAVISSSKQPQAALHFARYAAARDRGLKHYSEHGFKIVQGDVWSDTPELSVFAGSMLRPAIEETLVAFEKREGIRVTRVYNGCGILIAQMKAGQHPDAYFACDREFMSQVPELFSKPIDVSRNELVILVQKGNPLDIKDLRDLTRKGLRVGIGHEKQCAMGWLTQNTIKEAGIQKEVMENVTVQTPTGDMLVNQMRAGSLDAAVAYLSNAAGAAEHLDAIQIHGLSCAIATQPFAVADDSEHAQLADRLFQRLCSEESEQVFVDEGFRWSLPKSVDGSNGN